MRRKKTAEFKCRTKPIDVCVVHKYWRLFVECDCYGKFSSFSEYLTRDFDLEPFHMNVDRVIC